MTKPSCFMRVSSAEKKAMDIIPFLLQNSDRLWIYERWRAASSREVGI